MTDFDHGSKKPELVTATWKKIGKTIFACTDTNNCVDFVDLDSQECIVITKRAFCYISEIFQSYCQKKLDEESSVADTVTFPSMTAS